MTRQREDQVEHHSVSPTVSVLLVNWNTCDLLEQCLDSLQAAEPPGFLETLVVDNGSTDNSAAMARQHQLGVHLIENRNNIGFTAATNQAFERSQAPYCLMLNSDTVVGPGTISACIDVLQTQAKAAAVGCQLFNPDGTHQSSIFRFPSLRGLALNATYLSSLFPRSSSLNYDRYGFGEVDEITETDAVMGSFLLVDRQFLGDDPLLDNGYFMYAEELDLCQRLVNKGGAVLFNPSQSIIHISGASSKSPEQIAWSELAKRRGILRFMRKWRRSGAAEAANLIYLLELAPRTVVWGLSDASDKLRRRPNRRRLLRAHAARFHVQALVRPSHMDTSWGPPPVSRLE